MERKKYLRSKNVKIVLTILHIVGFVGFLIPASRAFFISLTPIHLLASAILLFSFHTPFNIKWILWGLAIAVFGYFIEVIGVKTGVLFGSYSYSDILGPKLLETPLIIGLLWLMLTYSTSLIMRTASASKIINAIFTGISMTLLDLLIEQFAIYFGLWSWNDGGIPIKNYVSWFIFGSLFSLSFNLLDSREKMDNAVAAWIPFLFASLFGLLYLILIR